MSYDCPRKKYSIYTLKITGVVSITPTWQASTDTVAKLLELGATVDATEKRKQTPLHRACERGRLDVVR